jgi:hypothetical protein
MSQTSVRRENQGRCLGRPVKDSFDDDDAFDPTEFAEDDDEF